MRIGENRLGFPCTEKYTCETDTPAHVYKDTTHTIYLLHTNIIETVSSLTCNME